MPKETFKKGDKVRLNDYHSDKKTAIVKSVVGSGVALGQQLEGFFTWNEADLIKVESSTFIISILIGNSDDKLSQKDWSYYLSDINGLIFNQPYKNMHFAGSSFPIQPKQNACWVMEFYEDERATLSLFKEVLERIKKNYNQDSIAWVEGISVFI